MDELLKSLLRKKITAFLGADTSIFTHKKTIVIQSPRVLPDKPASQKKLIDRLSDIEDLKAYRIICIDPEHGLTEELKIFKAQAKEIK